MSWLFSQALVEEYLAENCLGGEPFVQSSGSHTPQAFLPSDRTIRFWKLSRFGMTCSHLTDGHGEALLTWFLAGFRARTSVAQEKELV